MRHTRLKWLIQWFAMGLVGAIAVATIGLFLCQGMENSSNQSAQREARIRELRTGDLVIRVVDSHQRAIAAANVTIEQTAHAFEFGTALSTEMFRLSANAQEQAEYRQLAKQLFNAGVHENALKWYATEPVQGQVNYADADRILAWSQQNGLKIRGHTLFWAPEQWNQPWVKALSHQQLRLAVQRRAIDICRRYRGKIAEYDVLNEMLHGTFYQQRLGDGIVDQMFRWCHTADPTARLYVNDFDILNGEALNRYIDQIRALLKRGVPLGGIGVQGHIRQPITAERIQKSLDALAQFGLPIKITEFDAIAPTEQKQAQILQDLYQTAFAHPAVAGILMWGFWEGAHWEPKAALIKRNFQPTLAAQTYRDLVFKRWWTTIRSQTDRTGVVKIRAFFGQYRVTVNQQNQTQTQTFTFARTALPKTVILVLKPSHGSVPNMLMTHEEPPVVPLGKGDGDSRGFRQQQI